MNWDWIIGLIGVGIGALTVLARMFDKSLSVREHEEYKRSIERSLVELSRQYDRGNADLLLRFTREADRLEDRIKVLEQTRPTTGELMARLGRRGEGDGQ